MCIGNPDPRNLFERASRVFDGWDDPETGLRVLKLVPHRTVGLAGQVVRPLRTLYHQHMCFIDGGENLLLRGAPWTGESGDVRHTYFLNLTTGALHAEFPARHTPIEVHGRTRMLLARHEKDGTPEVVLFDLNSGRETASFGLAGWDLWGAHFLADGRRALVGHVRGRPYDEPCHSRFHLLVADDPSPPVCVLDAAGFFCNHIQGCPTDPDLFAYDRWPTPKRRADVVMHVMSLDGATHRALAPPTGGMRPGPLWGGQRDHFVWMPDGERLASYFSPIAPTSTDHFDFGWWISVMNWRTGEEVAVQYPPDRWGCNFQRSPDGRFIVSAGGRGFQKIYRIDVEELRHGWNERVLCTYPESVEDGQNKGPFHMPFVLPDQSGVVFAAGWPGPEDGVYLVQWPE